MRGVITSVRRDKGFCFLRGEDGVDRFVHASETRHGLDTLQKGMRVEFEHREHPRGPRAVGVRPEGWSD